MVSFYPNGCVMMFCSKGNVWLHFGTMGSYPILIIRIIQTLGLVFGREIKGIWQCVLQVNCSHISEIDVRLLNFQNRTSVAQVMVRLL